MYRWLACSKSVPFHFLVYGLFAHILKQVCMVKFEWIGKGETGINTAHNFDIRRCRAEVDNFNGQCIHWTFINCASCFFYFSNTWYKRSSKSSRMGFKVVISVQINFQLHLNDWFNQNKSTKWWKWTCSNTFRQEILTSCYCSFRNLGAILIRVPKMNNSHLTD